MPPMPTPRPTANLQDENVLTVTQLNRLARMLLEETFPSVLVEGEISNLAMPSSGHWYLTLKDDNAQIRCAMFRNRNMLVRCRPKDGMQVVVKARLSIYEGRGDYQLILEQLEETGAGALRRAFELLKTRLLQEGLFDPAHKKALPTLPGHIAVITSPTGAAIRDIISVFRRRFPAIALTIVPVTVQGEQAAAEMVRALVRVNARQGCLHDVDAILLARGGGSLEDLWSFNNEALARAIYASELPVVSAVGHETDFTIADFVADVRAATPSAAAELLSPHQEEYTQLFRQYTQQLRGLMRNNLQTLQLHLQRLRKQLRHPGRRLQEQAQRLDEMELRGRRAMVAVLHKARHRVALLQAGLLTRNPGVLLARHRQDTRHLQQRLLAAVRTALRRKQSQLREQGHALHTVSPLATLGRGYSITTREEGVITSYEQVQPGVTIRTRLADGILLSKVEKSLPE
jgi:exodeoxyribonuclease VII large subunit